VVIDHDERRGHDRIRLDKTDPTKHKELLISLMGQARGRVK
jgi:hypothetical protein